MLSRPRTPRRRPPTTRGRRRWARTRRRRTYGPRSNPRQPRVMIPTRSACLLVVLVGGALSACAGKEHAAADDAAAPPLPVASAAISVSAAPHPSLAAQAGKALFFDKALSASGKMSCATCHDPDHAYGPPND